MKSKPKIGKDDTDCVLQNVEVLRKRTIDFIESRTIDFIKGSSEGGR